VMHALMNAAWPGNIRELENFIERCVILSPGEQLIVPLAELKRTTTLPVSTFHQTERQAIIDALRASSGKIAGAGGAAERLGLKRTTLQNKMRRLSVSRTDYSNS
jgi:formate hydrogenlyase transcriptional activator